jgi:hypothetical protein
MYKRWSAMQHLRSSTRIWCRRRPPGSGPAKQRKKKDLDRASSSTTVCVWWRSQTPYARSNISEPHVREIEGEAKAKGIGLRGGAASSLYRGGGGGSTSTRCAPPPLGPAAPPRVWWGPAPHGPPAPLSLGVWPPPLMGFPLVAH